jgi:hypothetical protein
VIYEQKFFREDSHKEHKGREDHKEEGKGKREKGRGKRVFLFES